MIAVDKVSFRKIVLKKRNALSEDFIQSASVQIENRFLTLIELKSIRIIGMFAAFRSEVRTLNLARRLIALGKTVVFPKTLIDQDRLEFRVVTNPEEQLKPGVWNIPEPMDGLQVMPYSELELIVTPGAAFDRKGNRIGYGGGFYDRVFAGAPKALRVALAFDMQMVDEVPADSHDLPVHLAITETQEIRCSVCEISPSEIV